jgi:transposase
MKNIEYKPTNYPSDLTDAQWEKISEFFPMGNKGTVHKRSLVEAVLYIVKTGCQWRLLPHDYPNWSTVKSFYYRAIAKGIWEKVMQSLVKETRINAGRSESPSYALIDSQSVKTTADANNRGYDGGKKRKGVNVIS